jgi:hypothetical protein
MPNQLRRSAKRAKNDQGDTPERAPGARLATPAEYNAFVARVELRAIRLAHCELNARSRHTGVLLEPHVEEESTTFRTLDDGFLVFHALRFAGVPTEGNDDPVSIRATFELDYSADVAINDELFAVFRRYNLPVNVWPFFREFIHTVLARANWPVFVLPALQIPAGGAPRRQRTTQPL